VPETVGVSVHGRFPEKVRVTVRAVPTAELEDARRWIEDTVQLEAAQWLDEYRAAPEARQQHATSRWYWPSRERRGALWQ
jgi:hypothetical protein